MMTANPARFLHLTKKGRLVPGMDADIVIFDDEIEVKRVIIGGNTFTVRLCFIPNQDEWKSAVPRVALP